MSDANQGHEVHVFSWTEYERGWGQRPDGLSIHASEQAAASYLADFYQRTRRPGRVPDDYDAPDSDKPQKVLAESLVAQWVGEEGRRISRGLMLVKDGWLVFANPEFRARVESAVIEKHAKPALPGPTARL